MAAPALIPFILFSIYIPWLSFVIISAISFCALLRGLDVSGCFVPLKKFFHNTKQNEHHYNIFYLFRKTI